MAYIIEVENLSREDGLVNLSVQTPSVAKARRFIDMHQTILGSGWETADDLGGYVYTSVCDTFNLIDEIRKEEPKLSIDDSQYYPVEAFRVVLLKDGRRFGHPLYDRGNDDECKEAEAQLLSDNGIGGCPIESWSFLERPKED